MLLCRFTASVLHFSLCWRTTLCERKAPITLRNSAQGLIACYLWSRKMFGNINRGKRVDHFSIQNTHDWASVWAVPFVMTVIILTDSFCCSKKMQILQNLHLNIKHK